MKQELIQIMPEHGGHLWHCWINQRQDGRKGDEWEHSLYEFKHMVEWLQYGHERIAQAFEGRLPKTHRQCSHSPEETVPGNVLKCCIGTEVVKCEILASLRASVEENRTRATKYKNPYEGFTDADLYRLMSFTCAWHIYTTATGTPNRYWAIDTSEGYMLDVTDRMFWDRVHESMAMPVEEDEDE